MTCRGKTKISIDKSTIPVKAHGLDWGKKTMTFSTLNLYISFLFHIFYTLRYEWMRFMETYEGRRFISFLVKKMEISGNLEDKRCSWLLISGWSSLTASWGYRSPPVSLFGRIFRWCPVIPLAALPDEHWCFVERHVEKYYIYSMNFLSHLLTDFLIHFLF